MISIGTVHHMHISRHFLVATTSDKLKAGIMSSEPRILFIDAYDSFSNNIIALLEKECGILVTRIYIDACIPDFENFLLTFTAVVCGPGPGHPQRPEDVGLFRKIWNLPENRLLPTLGVCLGFQSLSYNYGASVARLPRPRHGIKTAVATTSTSIFNGLSSFNTVQYHSLYVSLSSEPPRSLRNNHFSTPSERCPHLQPLAWDLGPQSDVGPSFNVNPPSILMAVKHTNKPFYGIQFHPESICSDLSTKRIIANWWHIALAWSSQPSFKELAAAASMGSFRCRRSPMNSSVSSVSSSFSSTNSTLSETPPSTSSSMKGEVYPKFASVTLPAENLTISSICEALDLPSQDLVVLDSEMRLLPGLGEASIIGVVLPQTKKIQYTSGDNKASVIIKESIERVDLEGFNGSIYNYLRSFMSDHAIELDDDRAFCGGLMGYISYEAGLETIEVDTDTSASRPGICFAFIERSILIDHKRHVVHVQGLQYNKDDDGASHWVTTTASLLKHHAENIVEKPFAEPLSLAQDVLRKLQPEESHYRSKISQCQEQINAGESYELCLTDQTSVCLKHNNSAWDMYKNLRRLNPAPFGAFVRLGSLTLLSTSPERFLRFSRFEKRCPTHSEFSKTDEQVSICQLRPMKGTVRKKHEMPDGSVFHVCRDEATTILTTLKEQAENLMIIDLIRHDLHSICQDVSVPELMVVEDYESVFQLVSVIEGKISKPSHFGPGESKSGIDCLAASLPPGSMTGAPKKRSCQILQKIEGKPRSVYSGVLGYMDVTGKGDFSVIIRSMYRWDDEDEFGTATWNIGAGGAITTLSTEKGEWEEMLTKLQSTYRLFES